MMDSNLKYPVAGVVAIFIGVLVFLNCYTTVDSGEVKVERLFGKVNPVELTEGFHIVNPLADYTTYNTRDITLDIENIQIPAQDKLKTDFDVSLVIRFEGSGASDNIINVGEQEQVLQEIIRKKARSLLREVGKSVEKSQDFFLDRVQVEMQDAMLEGMNSYLRPYYASVKAVLFRDVTLPLVVSEAIIQTKERQEQLQREKAQLLIAEQKAQAQVKEAEAREMAAVADANASKTRADADAYVILEKAKAQAEANANASKTRADADAYVILEKAKAQAEANKQISRSLTTDLLQYKALEEWDGKYPTTLMGGDAIPLIQLPTGK